MLKNSYNREKLCGKLMYIIHLNDKNSKYTDFPITLNIQKVYKNLIIYINISYISFFAESLTYGY